MGTQFQVVFSSKEALRKELQGSTLSRQEGDTKIKLLRSVCDRISYQLMSRIER